MMLFYKGGENALPGIKIIISLSICIRIRFTLHHLIFQIAGS